MYLYLKQKVFTIGETYNFYDAAQNVLFHAKGSFFALPKEFSVFDYSGEVLKVERKIFSFLPVYKMIDTQAGYPIGEIRQKFGFLKNFRVDTGFGVFHVEGSLFGYQFSLVDESGSALMSVSKRYVSWGDTYEIDIDERRFPPKLACGIMIAFDHAVHNGN